MPAPMLTAITENAFCSMKSLDVSVSKAIKEKHVIKASTFTCTAEYSKVLDIDECGASPCQHGTCVNTAGAFHCDCQNTGFEGLFCHEDINECQAAPCNHRALCVNYDGDYTCLCPNGYEGRHCDTSNDVLLGKC